MDDLLRVYLDPAEIGPDGYPLVWHVTHGPRSGVKHMIREQAGHRCQRCRHPYPLGITESSPKGEWTPCDTSCTHGGPVRIREAALEDEWREYPDLAGRAAGDGILDEGPNGPIARWDVQAQWRILTVHHLNGIKHDLRWWNLAALCQRCHLLIQGKVVLERPWITPHTEWFRPHAAGYYASEGMAFIPGPPRRVVLGEGPEPSKQLVLENIDAILAAHQLQGTLL